MKSDGYVPVRTGGGIQGRVIGPSDSAPDEVAVELEGGRIISVPPTAFTRDDTGSWRLDAEISDLDAGISDEDPPGHREETVVPVLAEELEIEKRKRKTGAVRVAKSATERSETVSMPLERERAEVRRVVINREVDGPLPVRREGDTIIIPVVEEVPIVQKRLVLKEELHIVRKRSTEQHEETLTLREEHADVERVNERGERIAPQVVTETAATPGAQGRKRRLLEPDPSAKPARIRRNKIIKPE